jgi:hypothetical protein
MCYFIRWRHTEAGYVPDIPEGIGVLLLAEPGRACDRIDFALFKCDLPDGFEKAGGVHPVSDELADLLDSGEDYPPALALTREDMEGDESRSEGEFAEKLIERLTFYLQEQIALLSSWPRQKGRSVATSMPARIIGLWDTRTTRSCGSPEIISYITIRPKILSLIQGSWNVDSTERDDTETPNYGIGWPSVGPETAA